MARLPLRPVKEFKGGKTIVEGLRVERFVGPDCLMMLPSFLAAGSLPRAEILELAKRVQVPGYEHVRSLLQGSTCATQSTQFLGHQCYLQSEIGEMIALAPGR
jgi:hypothetical protein